MGKRGEGWVAVQFLLLGLILVSPVVQSIPMPIWLRLPGILVILIGGSMSALAMLNLGTNLTPFPKPKSSGYLVKSGVYALARHPIYSGIIIASFGWALATGTPIGLVLALLLFVFFDFKSRREEAWLCETYPEYPDYQTRVKKLIPFLY